MQVEWQVLPWNGQGSSLQAVEQRLYAMNTVKKHKKTKYIHEGGYVAEVDVELMITDDEWAPYLSSREDFDALNAAKREWLRTEVAAGIAAVERGEYRDYDEAGLVRLGERIKAEGRRIRVAK
ncbi:MAG: hypothetical protein LGR52_01655 [Candidatus Thiosymbion ectosymbiont of Robbea hypermnestra]|nr:hypothetical protein [Candidatus Thiosymbion ectosymbiont of Robbea hypermnestra]